MRTKQLCNDSWLFHDGEFSDPVPPYQTMKYFQAKCERATYGPAAVDPALAYETVSSHVWRTVTLPHDYIIEQSPQKQFNHSEGYFDYHNAWYRKHLFLSAEDATRRITLLFEGIATHATVYVNGCLLARNFCGYTSFEVDITDVARFDADNVIAVYVDSSSSFEGWWYQGGGIYRNVWLIKTEKLSVDLWGVQVCPQHLGNEVWDTDVTVTLRNDDLIDQAAAVRLEVLDEAGQCVAQSETSACVPSMAQATVCACLRVTAPKRWDILSPILYTLQTTVLASGAAVDCVRDTFGFRTIALDGQRGFFLNGRSVKLQGVCCHQDYGLTGKVLPDRVAEYRLRLLREMGANAYRTSHYPQGEATMDALDRLGFLVMAETRWFESTDTGMAQLAMLLKRDR
ncbi:MAG: glycoside hydrolase family 2 TIM barrel-domain containing protein, partial [Clostridia bacterium]